MPVTPSYPGVYVEEIPSGSRTITGVATSITAFIGRAKKGPVDDPILINNYGEFEQIFGGLWEHSNLGFAVRDFYNNGGSQAVIVRLYNPQDAKTKGNTKLFVPFSKATVTSEGTVTVGSGTPTTATVTGSAIVIESTVKGDSIAVTDKATVAIAGGTATVTNTNSNTVTAKVSQSQIKIPNTFNEAKISNKDNTAGVNITNQTITINTGTIIGETITVGECQVTGSTATVTGTTATVTGSTATVTGGTAIISSSGYKNNDKLKGGQADCGKVTGSSVEVTGNSIVTNADSISIAPSTVTGKTGTGKTGTVTSSNSHAVTIEGFINTIPSGLTDFSKNDKVTVTLSNSAISGDMVTFSKITEVENPETTTATVTGGTATVSGGTVTVTSSSGSVETLPTDKNIVELEAKNPGIWGDDLEAVVDRNFPTATKSKAENEKLFNLSIENKVTGEGEKFQNVSEESNHKRYVKNVLKNESRLVQCLNVTTRPDDTYIIDQKGNGQDGQALTSKNFTDGQSNKTGIYALENADLFNLLCIPPYKDDNNVDADVLTAAIGYCEKRRAMLILDAPSGWHKKEDAKEGIDTDIVGSTSKNAAIFFPRLKMPNPLKDYQMEIFAACGAVAGVIARTDGTRGVWKAPAGLDAVLRGVSDLSVPLTDAENGELNPLGINCLRVKPPAGKIIWGARTRVGNDMLASEWKYIPVRRLALYLEETLYRNTKWAVFEPNDEPLWAQLRLSIGAFMDNLFRQGAFQGSSPKDAYFVKCDKETTTQYDIDRGIVNILIGYAPLKPAEFVILKFQQIAGQS